MKIITRPLIALLFLVAFATPLCAQNPNVAIRLDAGKYCARGELKNLTSSTVTIYTIELWVYDEKSCKRVCVARKAINKKLASCNTLDFDLCCANRPPAFLPAIYYVRVRHSLGRNETWAWAT
jgi:hypothetical protein